MDENDSLISNSLRRAGVTSSEGSHLSDKGPVVLQGGMRLAYRVAYRVRVA